MINKKKIGVLCLLLLYLTGCSPSSLSKATDQKKSTYDLLAADQMKIQPFKKNEVTHTLKDLANEAENSQTWEDFKNWQKKAENIASQATNNLDIFIIHYYKNVTNEKNSKEMEQANALANRIDEAIQEQYAIQLSKSYGDKVKDYLSAYDLAKINSLTKTENGQSFRQLSNQLIIAQNKYMDKEHSQEVTYQGRHYTLSQLSQEKDKDLIEQHYYQELLDLYKEQIAIEKQLATILGYQDVPSMYHAQYNRPYTQQEVNAYENYVKQYFVPLVSKIPESKTIQLNQSLPTIITKDIGSPFKSIHPKVQQVWTLLLEKKLYDIKPSKNKLENWVAILGDNPPFMIGNFNDTADDLQTFIHEYGHFFAHVLQQENNFPTNNDIEEIYSQSLEVLMSYKVNDFVPNSKTLFMERIFINQLVVMPMMQ